ncbi:unnamed protein product [Strongylus vulgaris]|uniref:Uncharacterized protein n=1 Tax=Strongylus vulgaris TaxID=40348 RepID=A0A3P7JIU0_STRVU|nr:unnamed protein product [Strongylus vulgaris]
MRFTILLVVALAAIAFAKPHPRKDSSSEEDRKHKGPHRNHGHHHHRRTRPTTPQSVTASAMPGESSELPAVTTSAADKVVTDMPNTNLPAVTTSDEPVVTDVVTSEITAKPVLSTKESIVTPAEPEPSTDLPDTASSPAEVAMSDAVTVRVTAGQIAITIGDFNIPVEGVLP